jgi:hypothetical protein
MTRVEAYLQRVRCLPPVLSRLALEMEPYCTTFKLSSALCDVARLSSALSGTRMNSGRVAASECIGATHEEMTQFSLPWAIARVLVFWIHGTSDVILVQIH